ncbi:Hsp20/alpha crystallin family protein [Hahella aquimaris]|uniref:Hsp20/alpha crystallin family protein n=1 Tax=Hahella sp. HNIBRBA332 TaxID=3015983 RepID=UPI00273C04F3|nr:Hsp20/alpha crystallin family protein [Hahella sp. HNIBRBA332]WLQ13022.1 Hsp20/alpha crystallin family protein [Hahella sp. HNIBRBA332]
MAITRWNPFSEFEDILDRYNRSLQGQSRVSENGKEVIRKADWAPAVDITETKEAFLIKAELPGVDKSQVKVSVHEGVLSIQGERKLEKEEGDKKHHRVERFYGAFARSFTLPDNVDENNIRAEYRDGILTLHLSKVEKAQPKAIEINVQ